ncbi:hypothetical protein N7510_009401 [Penicillium lagena]|uniref:uncharacterized protein n=1 Tax=Penicillium lagena TaxID=94218 RepID=UPI00253FCA25|nr:uncharacterized protein N7510_009401 [Penicillium lagena]KAJ5606620.1 hypothetical protein N7510_009401 [Penicillium lagena]
MTEINPDQYVCDCLKTYERRDLFLRHRRRCQRPKKSTTRRKACDACVQSKARCSYTHPTCSRCATRAIPCVYAPQPSGVIGTGSAQQTPVDRASDFISPGGNLNWDLQGIGWHNNSLDLPVDLPTPSALLAAAQPSEAGQAEQDSVYDFMHGENLVSPPDLFSRPLSSSKALDADLTPPAESTLRGLVHLVCQYPQSLLRDEYCTPFLHQGMYDENTPDITTLEKTSMAICCGAAMETQDGARFTRRTMEVERRRLIDSYPTYRCMRQWDALHAMLVYEILELNASLQQETESWKQKPNAKGLKSPFLAKMTKYYTRCHLEDPSEDLLAPLGVSPMQTFEQWRVAETSRRTIFLAHIVHFLSNYDFKSGKQSIYYEPLDDNMLRNLPLPSSHTLWTARNEQEWSYTMEFQQNNIPPMTTDPSASHSVGVAGMTLQHLLSKFNKEFLRTSFTRSPGLGGSDELRDLIVLCALEQLT